jgi:hypothetical protein
MGERALPQQRDPPSNPVLLAAKRERLDEPHVARLGVLVREIANGRGRRGSVPFIDPDRGGDRPLVLMILESSGPMADTAGGSGFLSVDNNEETAANGRTAQRRRGGWRAGRGREGRGTSGAGGPGSVLLFRARD